jgi:PAS domain S-box-containing protein
MQLSGDVFQSIFDASPDALLAADGAGTVVFANLRAVELFGQPRHELVGTPVSGRILGRTSGDGVARTARRADGTELAVEVRSSTLDTGQGPLVASTIRELRPADPPVDLAQVAHDLNNLLSVISNYATLATRGTDDPAVVADLGQIRLATERAALLTGELLAAAGTDLDGVGGGSTAPAEGAR